MYELVEPRLQQAVIYTHDSDLVFQCADLFAHPPVNWITSQEATLAKNLVAGTRFDFIVVDLDSPEGRDILLHTVACGRSARCVVFAVTAGPVDIDLLNLCYENRIYYPVRPNEVVATIHTSLPRALSLSDANRNMLPVARPEHAVEPCGKPVAVSRVDALFGRISPRLITRTLARKDSLSASAQEKIASIVSAVGTAWYVEEITSQFQGIRNILPPSEGPTYLLAISLLLWLWAKQRRLVGRSLSNDEATLVQ